MSAAVALPSATDPFPRRLRAYLRERFPLLGHGILIASYYSSNQFLAHVLAHPGEPMRYSLATLAGAVTLFCFMLHLRVFDEHKDYEEDCRYHPQRVLQRGLVTLRHLRWLGALAITLEVALSAWRGPGALFAWGVAFLFSLLMLREFFVRDWLKRHFLLYATSHMLLMPLLSLMVYSFATGQAPTEAPGLFWLYAFVGFFVTFNWEVSRKIRAPEEEIEGVDSYTKVFGTYGAAWIVLAIRVIDTALVSIVGWQLGLGPGFYLFLVALFAVTGIGFVQYRRQPTPAHARRMEKYAGMYIIAFDAALAFELVRRHGLQVTW